MNSSILILIIFSHPNSKKWKYPVLLTEPDKSVNFVWKYLRLLMSQLSLLTHANFSLRKCVYKENESLALGLYLLTPDQYLVEQKYPRLKTFFATDVCSKNRSNYMLHHWSCSKALISWYLNIGYSVFSCSTSKTSSFEFEFDLVVGVLVGSVPRLFATCN